MGEIMRKSRVVRVEFEIELPCDATPDEVDEWVRFNMRGGTMDGDNALADFEMEAIKPPVLTDTGFHLHHSIEPTGPNRWLSRAWKEGAPFEGPWPEEVLAAHRASEPSDDRL